MASLLWERRQCREPRGLCRASVSGRGGVKKWIASQAPASGLETLWHHVRRAPVSMGVAWGGPCASGPHTCTPPLCDVTIVWRHGQKLRTH